jgi:hypothetical protein
MAVVAYFPKALKLQAEQFQSDSGSSLPEPVHVHTNTYLINRPCHLDYARTDAR